MRSKYVRSVVFLAALAGTGICSGSVFAADMAVQKHCEALAVRFKTTDMRHMSPDKLEKPLTASICANPSQRSASRRLISH